MSAEDDADVPETGAVFTFGKTQFADNIPNKFWIREDKVIQICCGDEHTTLVAGSGRIFMFGINEWGQLGVSHNKVVKKPTKLKALKAEKITKVACGRSHTLVATESGKLYSFGGNGEGQLGLGHSDNVNKPTIIEGLEDQQYSMLAAGAEHSLILTDTGKLFVCGSNSEGQLGIDDNESWQPVELSVDDKLTCIACGYYHTVIVTESGDVFTFGETEDGKLGLGYDPEEHTTPQKVEGIDGRVIFAACGGKHTALLTDKGKLYTFGDGSNGQLGHGNTLLASDKPRLVKFVKKSTRVKEVACGESHTAIITDKGELFTFGDGRHGKLALGEENFANQFKPTLVDRFSNFIVENVSCGGCHTLVTAKPRPEKRSDSSSSDENEFDNEDDLMIKTDMNGTVRNSMDLNGTISARNRRREKLPDPGDTINRTLPPLDSSLSVSQSRPLAPLSNSYPSPLPSRLNRGKLPTLKIESAKKNDSAESGVSVSDSSEDDAPAIKRTSAGMTKSAAPLPKPRATARKTDHTPLPALRRKPAPPQSDEDSDDKKDSDSSSNSEKENIIKKKPTTKVSRKGMKKHEKKKGMFGRRKILESDSEDDDKKYSDDESEHEKHMDSKLKPRLKLKLKESDEKDSEDDSELDQPKKGKGRKKIKKTKNQKKKKEDESEDESEEYSEPEEKITKKTLKLTKSRLTKKKKVESEKEDSEKEESESEKEIKKKIKKKGKKIEESDEESEEELQVKRKKKKKNKKESDSEPEDKQDEKQDKSDDENKEKDDKKVIPKPEEKKKSRTCVIL